MSLEEVITAAGRLSRQEQQHLVEELRARIEAGGDGAQPDDVRVLAAAAGVHWQGGDGLEFQRRIRAEWDDRTTPER